jgi:hypothetical protein
MRSLEHSNWCCYEYVQQQLQLCNPNRISTAKNETTDATVPIKTTCNFAIATFNVTVAFARRVTDVDHRFIFGKTIKI